MWLVESRPQTPPSARGFGSGNETSMWHVSCVAIVDSPPDHLHKAPQQWVTLLRSIFDKRGQEINIDLTLLFVDTIVEKGELAWQ